MAIPSLGTVNNRGTFVVTAVYTDDSGAEVTPSSIVFNLTDEFGNILNDREDVSVTPASTIHIVLSGDDLDQEDSDTRIITIEAVYDSLQYGNNLTKNDQGQITINDWVDPEPVTV